MDYSDEVWYIGRSELLPKCSVVVDAHIKYLICIFHPMVAHAVYSVIIASLEAKNHKILSLSIFVCFIPLKDVTITEYFFKLCNHSNMY